MRSWGKTLETAIGGTSQNGLEEAPSSLLGCCGKLDDPVGALSNHDLGNAIFDALAEEFGFIRLAKASDQHLPESDIQRLSGLLRWFLNGLVKWRRADDPRSCGLVSLFVVACYIDIDGLIWRLVPECVGQNTELTGALAQFIARSRLDLTLGAYSPRPILEREALDQFKNADASGDWTVLRLMVEQVNFAFFTNVILVQVVRYLNRFDFGLLAESGRAVRQTGIAMQIVTALSASDALRLGLESQSAYLQFAAVCRLLSPWDRETTMEVEDTRALKALLLLVSADKHRWRAWMDAFNAHPLRAQILQKALGEALAEVSDDAVSAYVESITLSSSSIGRDEIADCLRAFRKCAALERRQLLWQLAYKRWSEWNYGQFDGYTNLIEVVVSPVDYAIVGYAVECISKQEREDLIAQTLLVASETEDTWHASASDYISDYYRSLSRMQPFVHARSLETEGDDWLMVGRTYLPDYLRGSLYFKLRCWVRNEISPSSINQ